MPHTPAFLRDGGELGALIRAYDWAATPLGPQRAWPQSLRTATRLILNTHHPMYIFWGVDGLCLYNDAYGQLIGPERHPSSLGRPAREVWDEIWPIIGPQIEQVMAGRGATWHENALVPITRAGRREDVYWTYGYSPIDDETANGGVGGVLVICTETTGQVAAEQALRESEHRLLALNSTLEQRVEAGTRERNRTWRLARDLLVVVGFDGTFLAVNDAWTTLLGWSEAELIGERFIALTHPDDLAPLREVLATIGATPLTQPYDYRVRHKDGGYRRIAWTAAAEEGRIYATGRDVTHDQERETALNDVTDFARLALSAVGGVGVWTYDIANDLFVCDAAIARLYGLEIGSAAAGLSRAQFLANIHPEDVERVRATMDAALTMPGDVELEYRIRHPDGSVRWVLSRAHTSFGQAGRPARRTGVGVEFTKQRLLEEQLRQSQKLEAIGQLTGGVAHDFNNLLTVIRSSIDLMKRPDLAEERRVRYIGAIADTVDRAAKLTGQLLAFARRQSLKPEIFDVGESLRTIDEMVSTLSGSRVRITTHVPATPVFVNADANQFDTAIVNMAVNARDAMAGDGELTIALGSVTEIPATRTHPAIAGRFVALSLADTGSGMRPELLEQIFEPFFTTKSVGHGTGLGLSQVFGFAKQSGGEVAVTSKVGEGTTFTLYLPEVAEGPPTAAAEPAEPLMDGHGVCVLVVEDNPDVGLFTTQSLAELGFSTVYAANADEALAELEQDCERFDVVFSDVVMPGRGGVELAQEIGRRHPRVPIVLTSGYSHVLAQNGSFGFELLQKPYSVEDLSRVLRKAVASRRASCTSPPAM